MKKIIYIYDSLCPWCYAFTPIVKKLYENYNKEFEFEVISGGLVINEEVKLIGGKEESDRLRKGYKIIEDKTESRFGENFFQLIEKGSFLMNSEIPAIALSVFREVESKGSSIEFVHKLLNFIFLEGMNPNDEGIYKNLATYFNLHPETFIKSMEDDYYKQQARYDFALAKQLQAEAFPRLYLQSSDTNFYLISKGYSDYDNISKIIDKIKSEL